MVLALLSVLDGVAHDVGDVLVGELVGHLAAAPDALDEVGAAQDAQVLADQGCGRSSVSTSSWTQRSPVGKLGNQRDPDGGREGSEELASLVVAVHRSGVSHMRRLPYMHGSYQVTASGRACGRLAADGR